MNRLMNRILNHVKNERLGTLALVLATTFVCAGLPAQIIKVWQTKSVADVSFLFIFFFLVQAVVWVFYGIQKRDWAIGVPNVAASIFGAILLFEWFLFK